MASKWPPLNDVERLSDRVVRILGQNPGKFTLQGSNTYLIGTGPQRILIDSGQGIPNWFTLLKQTLSSENASLSTVLITHWHGDHVGGIKDLLTLSPQPTIYKHHPASGQTDIQNGQAFSVPDSTLKAYHSPGHTTDHMSFILEEEDAIFTGDNVLGHGTAVFEDLPLYLQSLKGMATQASGRGYPGHGEVLPSAAARIEEYIAHRSQREREVLSVLLKETKGDSGLDTMGLVKIIYRDTPESLHLAAARGVSQILEKLAEEGKVQQNEDEGTWVPTDKAVLEAKAKTATA